MRPPSSLDFDTFLDAHCYVATDPDRVMALARHLGVQEVLREYPREAILLSFFFTDRKKRLDLVVFSWLPDETPGQQLRCFYFVDFLRCGYDIGSRLESVLPKSLAAAPNFSRELSVSLNKLLPEIYAHAQADYFARGGGWGFRVSRFLNRAVGLN